MTACGGHSMSIDEVRAALVGTKVTHGNLTGTVMNVTPEYITVTSGAGMIVKVPIPAHLQALLEEPDA